METTKYPENQTSNFPTYELSKLRPGVAPPNVVGKATFSNASAQTQTGAYRIPFGTLPVRRGGTRTGRRNCHATDQLRVRDTNFPATVHSGPLNLPNLGGTPEPECCSAVPTGPWWRRYPPLSREDDYTDKRSAHNILRYGSFVYTPLVTHLREITGQPSHLLAFARTFGPNNFSTHKNNDDATRPPPKAQGADEQREEETERSRRIYLSPALPSRSSETAACSRADSSDPHRRTWRRVPDRDEKIVMVPPADGCLARSARDT